MSYKRFIDVASYQPDDLAYFQAAKRAGISAVIVKLTEGGTGTKYINPKATNQIKNAKKAGLIVHTYHFLKATSDSDARGECRYYVQQAKARGIGADSIMAIDVEDGSLTRNKTALTSYINSFTDELHKQGYPKVSIYSNTSWFNLRIDRSKLTGQSLWVAAYEVSQPGIDNADAWQYSSGLVINGARTDVSYDFTGFYTNGKTSKPTKPTAPNKPAKAPAKKPAKPVSKPKYQTFKDSLGVTWYKESATFKLNQSINLRWGARSNSSLITTLPAGSVIKYDAFCYSGGYVWLRQPRGNGQYGYLVSGQAKGNKRVSSWGSFK